MVVDAQVVVDPHPRRPERGVEPRHFADVGKKRRLARAVAGLAFHARASGESAPCLAGDALLQRQVVAVAQRGLELEARHDASAPKLLRVTRKTRSVCTVPVHLREADASGEPHFVAGRAVRRQRLERLRPLRVVRRVRAAQTHQHQRFVRCRRNNRHREDRSNQSSHFSFPFIASTLICNLAPFCFTPIHSITPPST